MNCAWEGETQSIEERETRDSGVKPILMEEQIVFAAEFVAERIAEIIEMTRRSLENLESIFVGPRGDPLEPQVGTSSNVSLGLEDSTFHFVPDQQKQVLSLLDSLRASLAEWAKVARQEASESRSRAFGTTSAQSSVHSAR